MQFLEFCRKSNQLLKQSTSASFIASIVGSMGEFVVASIFTTFEDNKDHIFVACLVSSSLSCSLFEVFLLYVCDIFIFSAFDCDILFGYFFK